MKELRGLGLTPDFIVCRSKAVVETASRNKIGLFCNVAVENVLSIHDLTNIYHVPLLMLEQNFDALLAKRLGLFPRVDDTGLGHFSREDSNDSCRPSSELVGPGDMAVTSSERSLQHPRVSQGVVLPPMTSFYRDWKDVAFSIDSATAEARIALVRRRPFVRT